jgi:Holliday junction resolvasome RuvABC endonuclease subunit
MVKILALDLGTKTGWAWHNGEICKSGTRHNKATKIHHPGHVYHVFHAWLDSLLDAFNPDVVYYEKVMRHAGVYAAHMYGGWQAILLMECEARDIRVEPTPVKTIKLHATGSGEASKGLMISAMSTPDFQPVDDNEADALALLNYARSQET